MAWSDAVTALIEGLNSNDGTVRLASLQQLCDVRPQGLSVEEGLAVLQAVRREWPEVTVPLFGARTGLLAILTQSPHAEYLPELLQVYSQLDERARWQALKLISCLPQREAAEAWLRLYRGELRQRRGNPPPFGEWSRRGLHAELLLPALLEFADAAPDAGPRWYRYIDQYLKACPTHPELQDQLIAAYLALRPALLAAENAAGQAGWLWRPSYVDQRSRAAQLLRVFAHLEREKVEPFLREALAYADPRLSCTAALSLLGIGQEVHQDVFAAIASHPEMRRDLHRALVRIGREGMFPREWATQPLMAESDMVGWIIRDTGCAPSAIQLVGSAIVDHLYYVFGFRFGPESAWTAGVCGPWPASGLERMQDSGGVFSDFRPLSDASVENHLKRMLL